MKLYLHNLLQDNTEKGSFFPLKIEASDVQDTPVEYNAETVDRYVKRLDLPALVGACKDLGIEFEPPADLQNMTDEQKRQMHHVLFEVEVVTGELVSPSGRRFPIVKGVPDMIPENPAPPAAQ